MGTDLFLLAVFFLGLLLFYYLSIRPSTHLPASRLEEKCMAISDREFFLQYSFSEKIFQAFVNRLQANGKETLAAYWKKNRHAGIYEVSHSNSPIAEIVEAQLAMEAWCEWLSLEYHIDSGRKFRKVFFRVPDAADLEKMRARSIIPDPNPAAGIPVILQVIDP